METLCTEAVPGSQGVGAENAGLAPSTSLLKTELDKFHPDSSVLSESHLSSAVKSQVKGSTLSCFKKGTSHGRGTEDKASLQIIPTAYVMACGVF